MTLREKAIEQLERISSRLASIGDYYEHKEFANTIYVYDARAPRLANCTIDKRLWDTPFQRGEKV